MFKVPVNRSLEKYLEYGLKEVKLNDRLDKTAENLGLDTLDLIVVKDSMNDSIIGYYRVDDEFKEELSKGSYESLLREDFSIMLADDIESIYEKFLDKNPNLYIVLDDKKNIKGYLNKERIENVLYKKIREDFDTLRFIAQEVDEGIAAIDADGVVIMWNRFMENRYNIKSEDFIGRKMSDLLEDTVSERALNIKEALSDIYYSNKNLKGVDQYGVVNAKPLYYNGEFKGVVCTEVDVSEVTRLSKELEITQEKLKYLENEVRSLSKSGFDKILGKSGALEKAKNMAKQVAKTNSSIMLNGESGTGKEVFARAIHQYSERPGTFIPVNCSAIPQELFESEFFGYAPGAFTGATKKGKAGIFELANNGTVFLDEIGDLPFSMQAKLLRVLQEKEVMRVGGSELFKINVRIISASNKDLKEMVREGKFREDLYYRLNVVNINLPPLRERSEDIGILIYHFLEEQSTENNKPFLKISRDAYKLLQKYRWKGNIRELKNTIENMVVLASKPIIEVEDIPEYIIDSVKTPGEAVSYPMDLGKAVEILEINKIKEALEMTKGNKSKAAKILNIPRTTLYYKMEHYKIDE